MTVWRGKHTDRFSPTSHHFLLKSPRTLRVFPRVFSQAACYWMRQQSHAHLNQVMHVTEETHNQ